MNQVKNYINGKIQSSSKKYLDIYDPSTGEKTSEVVLSNEIDFDETIKSSKAAFDTWSLNTPLKRSRILSKFKITAIS